MKSVKKPEIYEDKWITTTCVMCYSGCTVRVRVVNGVAVKIEGVPEARAIIPPCM
mgnify:CR=1 FL=1